MKPSCCTKWETSGSGRSGSGVGSRAFSWICRSAIGSPKSTGISLCAQPTRSRPITGKPSEADLQLNIDPSSGNASVRRTNRITGWSVSKPTKSSLPTAWLTSNPKRTSSSPYSSPSSADAKQSFSPSALQSFARPAFQSFSPSVFSPVSPSALQPFSLS